MLWNCMKNLFFMLFCGWIWDWMNCRVMKWCQGLMVRWRVMWVPSQRRRWGYGFLKRHHLFWVIHRWIKWLVKARATSKVAADRGWRMIISLCHRLVLTPIPREEGFYGRNKPTNKPQFSISRTRFNRPSSHVFLLCRCF